MAENTDNLFSMSLEELLNIEVETQKVPESFQKVPVSSTLYTHEQIANSHIVDIYDLAEFVPNFSFRPSFGKLLERGVTRGVANITGNNVTGIFIDGLSFSNVVSSISLQDFKYVEVIRGPQATLYGRDTFAGAVNLVSKDPLVNISKELSVTVSDQGFSALTASYGKQYSDSFGIQINLKHKQNAGDYNNETGDGGGNLNQREHQYGHLALSYSMGDFKWRTNAYIFADKDSSFPTVMQSAVQNNCYLETRRQYYCGILNQPKSQGQNNTWLNGQGGLWKDAHLLTSIMNLQLSQQHDVSFNFGLLDNKMSYFVDGDYSDYSFSWIDVENAMQTKEADFKLHSVWNKSLETIIGYTHYEQDTKSKIQSFLDFSGTVSPASDSSSISNVNYSALYVRASYKLSQAQDIILDLRLSQDEIGFVATENSGIKDFNDNKSKITYRHELHTNNFWYISLGEGNKPGGFNVNLYDKEFTDSLDAELVRSYQSFDQEKLWQLESGYKGLSADKSISTKLSAFYTHWQDLQTSQSITFKLANDSVKTESVIANNGKSKNYGIETELIWMPSELTKVWLSYGWVKTSLSEASTAAQFELLGDGDVSGNVVPNVPEHTLAVGINNQFQYNKWSVSPFASFHYESQRFVAEHNLAIVDDISKLRIGINAQRSHWEFSMFAELAQNNGYIESAARLGDPLTFFRLRSFGLTLADKNRFYTRLSYTF
ncbi:TonB-dependent receptor plug domain-containing protein [Paraglaciecola aquimarina]|uniref:TonB-dependent receptor plug domain-containing protein n=2 Tax=Paraglaciecola algarum TaxID=3050085 RepID=A0ABS9D644_9ALTE|nr:TonB-dependent receptor plug domain-containing protein [Paraglaciecola sp. G1-23]